MKVFRIVVAGVLALSWAAPAAAGCFVSQAFSPTQKIHVLYHNELIQTKKSVVCSLFGLTNIGLAADLKNLAIAGKSVRIGLDHRQSSFLPEQWQAIRAVGGEVRVTPTGVLQHNKFCVIDGRIVLTGSWNWSNSAPRQDNNGVVIKSCSVTAKAFTAEFERIWLRDEVKQAEQVIQ